MNYHLRHVFPSFCSSGMSCFEKILRMNNLVKDEEEEEIHLDLLIGAYNVHKMVLIKWFLSNTFPLSQQAFKYSNKYQTYQAEC